MLSINVETIVMIASAATGISVGNASARPVIMSARACAPVSISVGPASAIIVTMIVGNWLIMFATIGIKFCKNVIRVVLRFSSIGPISSPNAIAPNVSVNAAFKALNEPVKVSLASLAVVPVMPSSSWMTWIASYTSDRLSILYSTPVSF